MQGTYNPTVQFDAYTLITGAEHRGCVEQPSDLKGVVVESESRDYQEVMDNALQLLRLLMRDERAAKFEGFVRASGIRGLRLAELAAATGCTGPMA